mgnify:FL=1
MHMVLAIWLLAAQAKAPVVPASLPLVALVDLDQSPRNLGAPVLGAARVLVFVTTECPIANGNIPTLNGLHARFAPKGVELFAVVSDPFITRSEATSHYRDFKARFPVLFDASCQLRDALRPTHVPEAFVFDGRGKLVYRGAIDNGWEEVGKRRQVVTRHYLADTLQRLLDKQLPEQATTLPVGCPVEYGTPGNKPPSITWTRDIAPLLAARCGDCHRPAGTAFDLTGLNNARNHGHKILQTPCSGPSSPLRPFSGNETGLLREWIRGGFPAGDPADWPVKRP